MSITVLSQYQLLACRFLAGMLITFNNAFSDIETIETKTLHTEIRDSIFHAMLSKTG